MDFYDRRFVATDLENPSFATVARAMGAKGRTVDRLAAIGDALREACAAQVGAGPPCWRSWRAASSGDPFRRDALSKPVRQLD